MSEKWNGNRPERNRLMNIRYQDDHYLIRSIQPQDKDQYLNMCFDADDVVHRDLKYRDEYWEAQLEGEMIIHMIVFPVDSLIPVAGCSFSDFEDRDSVQLNCTVAEQYRRKGIGTWVLQTLAMLAKENFQDADIMAYADVDDEASQHLIEKCGGKFVKLTDSYPAELAKGMLEYVKENNKPMSEEAKVNLQKIAEAGHDTVMVYKMMV